ncbi:hypothetical protein [Sorangium sp. So ce117]
MQARLDAPSLEERDADALAFAEGRCAALTQAIGDARPLRFVSREGEED